VLSEAGCGLEMGERCEWSGCGVGVGSEWARAVRGGEGVSERAAGVECEWGVSWRAGVGR
jgi:hypothetical protein